MTIFASITIPYLSKTDDKCQELICTQYGNHMKIIYS